MNSFNAIFLGILQGLTEFLPVSSSGHLVIVQNIIPNFHQPGVLFDVVLHAGTLASILIYYRKTILKLSRKYLLMLLTASVPAAFFGLFFQDFFEGLFKNVGLVGIALVVTGFINYLTDRTKSKKRSTTCRSSFFIGIAQSFAIIPGISRSGSTIFAGTKLGLSKEKAAEFSFLLSVPAVVGANLLQIIKYGSLGDGETTFYLLGFLAAFLSGLIAICLVLSFLKQKKFKMFTIYCFLLGTFVLLQ